MYINNDDNLYFDIAYYDPLIDDTLFCFHVSSKFSMSKDYK